MLALVTMKELVCMCMAMSPTHHKHNMNEAIYSSDYLICSVHLKKGRRQVNEKREYRDGIKRKETRQGWMDGWMLPW